MNSPTEIDASLQAVASDIRKLDPDGARTARVLRETLDQLYDGQRTGRYRPDQLYKTEKTHCGTLVEINLQREFKFQDGIDLDYQIAGVDVDCKFSQTLNGWMIPPEARRKLCLVVWAEDTATPHWSMGLVRVTDDRLNNGSNRDAKSTLNAAGRKAIVWLFQERPLPSNVLLQLDRPTVDRIMSLKSGQKRINELFRMALCRIVSRTVIATVAQQDDYMKRIRANGGARTTLLPEGIIILGQYHSHSDIAAALGVPVPGSGDSVPVRVTKAREAGPGTARIKGEFWKVALPSDASAGAPQIPVLRSRTEKVVASKMGADSRSR